YEAGLTDDSVASVHNIEPFDIPRSWDCIGGIDVGGESPWAVVPAYIDPRGDIILDEGFHHRTGRVSEVAGWIKRKMPWNEKGSPRMFVMKRATTIRKELDTAKWDPTKPDRMFKSSTARYDAVESVRYICMTRPEPSKDELREDKFTEMERLDPTTAKEWKA